MGLAERAAGGPPKTRKGVQCSVGRLLDSLPTADTEALASMLGDKGWQHTQIAKAITEETGQRISAQTVSRHRDRVCNCS